MKSNSSKYSVGRVHVTPWVALIIFTAVSATFGFFIWMNAHESWLYEDTYTKYPTVRKHVSSLVTTIETVGWKTYRDEGYGFQVRHPSKYQEGVGKIVSSVFGVSATSVGPLTFVKAESLALRTTVNAAFESYWNNKNCVKKAVNTGLDIKLAFCTISGKPANYALVKGDDFDIFVDGYTFGYDKELASLYGGAKNTMSQSEMLTILSSFKFAE
jgi:hypothetical protein